MMMMAMMERMMDGKRGEHTVWALDYISRRRTRRYMYAEVIVLSEVLSNIYITYQSPGQISLNLRWESGIGNWELVPYGFP